MSRSEGSPLHVVLGATGTMGLAVVAELKKRKLPVRAVGRSVFPDAEVEFCQADVLDREALSRAATGASHVHLCVGLPYSSTLWSRDWPRIMENTIHVCRENGAKMVFLDNIYMYGPGPLANPITEEHQQSPVTRKGRARKRTTDLVVSAMESGQINAVIGRSADFYGPGSRNSPLYISFLQNMLRGKGPQWMGRPGCVHTYSYTGDNARALVDLALEDSCQGQIWHLPVGEPITIENLAQILNRKLGTSWGVSFMPRPLLKVLSLFVPILGEVREMLYQFDHDYLLSHKRFLEKFPGFRVTSYEKGLENMIESFR